MELLDRAAETPLSVTVKNPVDGSPLTLQLTDADLIDRAVQRLLRRRDVVRALPYVIDRLAEGDAEAAAPLAQRNVDDVDRASEGLHLSIDCAEEAPFNDDERIAAALARRPAPRALRAVRRIPRGLRAVGASPHSPSTENAPVTSAIPTLLTTGGYDPVTPTAFAESTAETSRRRTTSTRSPARATGRCGRTGSTTAPRGSRSSSCAIPSRLRTRRASTRCRRPTSSPARTSSRRHRSIGSTATSCAIAIRCRSRSRH